MQRILRGKTLLRLCLATVAIVSGGFAHAASIAKTTIYWDTFSVTANSLDVTNSLAWSDQEDIIDSTYWEVDDTIEIETFHDIIPNPNWATPQTTNDGGLLAAANTSVSSTLISADVTTQLSSEASAYVSRFGIFTAPDAGTYTFSVDYSLAAEINGLNTELGAPAGLEPAAFPYVELQFLNKNTGDFVFVFDDTSLIDNVFDSLTSTGTLSITQLSGGSDINFAAGDLIEITATIDNTSRSFSTQSALVPLPPAIWMLASALGLLSFFRRAVIS